MRNVLVVILGLAFMGLPASVRAADTIGPLLPSARSDAKPSLPACADQAWDASWKRFFHPGTKLFYDYLSNYAPGRELAHLPTAGEVARQYPNPYGYGTGMEDCMISAGVMLSMIADRYAVTKEEMLRKRAAAVFQGIQLCATAHGVPGFWRVAFAPRTARASTSIPRGISTRMPCMGFGSIFTARCALAKPKRRSPGFVRQSLIG